MELRKAGDALSQARDETSPGCGLIEELFCSFDYCPSDPICSRTALFKRRTFIHPSASSKVQAACCTFSTFFRTIDKKYIAMGSLNLPRLLTSFLVAVSQRLSYYRITDGNSSKGAPRMFFALFNLLCYPGLKNAFLESALHYAIQN